MGLFVTADLSHFRGQIEYKLGPIEKTAVYLEIGPFISNLKTFNNGRKINIQSQTVQHRRLDIL